LNDQSTQSKSAQLIGLGLTYSLYEKTTVYASYGKMSNNGNASYSLLNSGDLVGNVSAAGVSPTGAMVGLNLAF
jgi:predicted porin